MLFLEFKKKKNLFNFANKMQTANLFVILYKMLKKQLAVNTQKMLVKLILRKAYLAKSDGFIKH